MSTENPQQPSEEEIRAALEEQLRRLRVEDVVLQTVATLINIAVLRLGLAGEEAEKDPDQARMAIEAVRALLPVVPEEQAPAVKDALSQVQMAFAREAQGAPAQEEPPQAAEGAATQATEEDPERERARSKIWTPPGS
jgi:hypothetical protein